MIPLCHRIKLFLFFCFFLPHAGFCSELPDWTDINYRQSHFPKTEYLSGFASNNLVGSITEGDFMKRLETDARNQLVQSIQVTVKVQSSLNTSSVNSNNKNFDFNQDLKENSELLSNASVVGLKIESSYDRSQKIGYAFAYIRISDFANYYKSNVDNHLDQVKALIDESKTYLLTGRPQLAFTKLERALHVFSLTDNPLNVLLALGQDMVVNSFNDDIQKYKLDIASTVNMAIDNLAGDITLKPVSRDVEINLKQYENFIEISALKRRQEATRLANIPIVIINVEDNSRVCRTVTDYAGNSKCLVKSLNIYGKIMTLKAVVDVEKMFGIDTTSLVYRTYMDNNNALPSAGIVARIKGFFAYVETDEKFVNVSLTSPIMLPKVKEALSSVGCTMVNSANDAELVVIVTANTRTNIQQSYVSSVFAEAKVSVLNVNSGNQLLSKVYSNVRGFGDTLDAAGASAYDAVLKDMILDIKKNILK
jgi:hypothetical protein